MTQEGSAFIALEGCEGAGKTTLIKSLKMECNGHPVCFTREPGGTAVGAEVRKILMDGKQRGMTPETELLLFLASRSQHCAEIVTPALTGGKRVVCDRFDASTFAYQIVGHEHRKLEQHFWNSRFLFPEPDLYVFLKIDPALGLARIAGREGEKTPFDRRPLAFHQRVALGYEEFFSHLVGGRVLSIDASLSEEEVFDRVLAQISRLLGIGGIAFRKK